MVEQQCLGQLAIKMLANLLLKLCGTNRIKSGLHEWSIDRDGRANHLGGDVGQSLKQGITRFSMPILRQLFVCYIRLRLQNMHRGRVKRQRVCDGSQSRMVKQQSLGQLGIKMLANLLLKLCGTNRIKSGLHEWSIDRDGRANHLGGDVGQFLKQGVT